MQRACQPVPHVSLSADQHEPGLTHNTLPLVTLQDSQVGACSHSANLWPIQASLQASNTTTVTLRGYCTSMDPSLGSPALRFGPASWIRFLLGSCGPAVVMAVEQHCLSCGWAVQATQCVLKVQGWGVSIVTHHSMTHHIRRTAMTRAAMQTCREAPQEPWMLDGASLRLGPHTVHGLSGQTITLCIT